MNTNVLIKRLSKKEKGIKGRIRSYSKWCIRYQKAVVINYLKARIVEEEEQLNALYRAYGRNFKRRIDVLEELLDEQQSHEVGHRHMIGIWKRMKLKKLQEEYDQLIEVSLGNVSVE